jgi:hypothetical protein
MARTIFFCRGSEATNGSSLGRFVQKEHAHGCPRLSSLTPGSEILRFSADFYEVSTPISTLVLLRFYPVSTRTEGQRMRRDAWRRSTKTTRGTCGAVLCLKDAKRGA